MDRTHEEQDPFMTDIIILRLGWGFNYSSFQIKFYSNRLQWLALPFSHYINIKSAT